LVDIDMPLTGLSIEVIRVTGFGNLLHLLTFSFSRFLRPGLLNLPAVYLLAHLKREQERVRHHR